MQSVYICMKNFISVCFIQILKMHISRIEYLGNLRTKLTHLKSANAVITDAPVHKEGKVEAFSPTDLVSTALGSCMITIVGIAAREHGLNIDGTEINISKIMLADPRRIGEVHVEFNFPDIKYSNKEKKIIEKSALTCPVAKSLHPELKQVVTFKYKN